MLDNFDLTVFRVTSEPTLLSILFSTDIES